MREDVKQDVAVGRIESANISESILYYYIHTTAMLDLINCLQ